MNLILITEKYPYGHGETFVANELHIAEKRFSHIYIICAEPERTEHIQYIPDNATVVTYKKTLGRMLEAVIRSFSISTIKDIWYSKIVLEQRVDSVTFKKIISANLFACSYKQLLKRFDLFDETIVYSYWLNGLAWGALKIGRKIGAKLTIARTHGVDCFVNRGYQPYRREIISEMDIIYSISQKGEDELKKRIVPTVSGKRHCAQIKVERLGVLKGELNPVKSSEALVLVSCSHIIRLKRLDLLVDAFEKIDDISIEWIHFGSGDLSNAIIHYAEEKLNKKSNIKYYFAGEVSNEKIHQYYIQNHIDAFINCSDYEGIPVSIMEAMAHGIPVIARDVGGISEIVEFESGWLLPQKPDAEKLASVIYEISHMTDTEMEKKREGAYNKWNSKYNAESNYNHFYDELFSLCKNGGIINQQ